MDCTKQTNWQLVSDFTCSLSYEAYQVRSSVHFCRFVHALMYVFIIMILACSVTLL